MLPARLRPTAIFTVLGVALFSATPVVRWCSVSWADVRLECFVTCSDRTACAASKPQCAEAAASKKQCEEASAACGVASSAAKPACDATADETPRPSGGASGKRTFCVDGLVGGPGEPGPSLGTLAAPAKAKAPPPVAPKLQPLTVHRPRVEATPPPRPPNRPGASPVSPRAPPNVFLHGVY